MVGKDMIMMSVRELKRLKLIQSAMDRKMPQKSVSRLLGLSERQVRRLVKTVRENGDSAILHGSRGRPSNHRLSESVKARVIRLYKTRYPDFGPTLATEKLLEIDGIRISDETLRKWLLAAGIWQKRRKRSAYRQWRPRRSFFGEMVQLDGSHHAWLEDRGPKLVLMAYIDDATNTTYARFYDYEVWPANETDAHVKLPGHFNLDKYLCIKAQRTVRKDNIVAYHKKLYQLEENDSKKICIEERIDGSFLIISKGVALKYKTITEQPKRIVAKIDWRQFNRPVKPY